MLQLAALRLKGIDNTALVCDDAFTLACLPRRFDGGFAGFWYSHLRLDQTRDFLSHWHTRLLPGSRVVLLDNCYVEGSSTPLCRTDAAGNTWQMRSVGKTGEQFEVLKNFPSAQSFARQLPATTGDLDFVETQYYWYASYQISG